MAWCRAAWYACIARIGNSVHVTKWHAAVHAVRSMNLSETVYNIIDLMDYFTRRFYAQQQFPVPSVLD